MIKSKFVYVTPYYNTGDDIEKTVFSMLAQSHNDWHAVMINDMSTDDTPTNLHNLIQRLPAKHANKFTLINNAEKHGEVRNTLKCIEFISDDSVVCRLDGGDWLTENDLLVMLESVYSDETVSVAWTAQRWAYTHQNISGPLKLMPGQTVYDHPWVSSHLKTFRCRDLKRVPDVNFRDQNGDYITIACDQAVFLPMMHMASLAGKKLLFLPVVGYHYSINLGDENLFKSERSLKQKVSAEWIRARGFVS